jgi:hypothetical protein
MIPGVARTPLKKLNLDSDQLLNKTYATYREFAETALAFLRKKVRKCWPALCNWVTDNFRVINPKDFPVLA